MFGKLISSLVSDKLNDLPLWVREFQMVYFYAARLMCLFTHDLVHSTREFTLSSWVVSRRSDCWKQNLFQRLVLNQTYNIRRHLSYCKPVVVLVLG